MYHSPDTTCTIAHCDYMNATVKANVQKGHMYCQQCRKCGNIDNLCNVEDKWDFVISIKICKVCVEIKDILGMCSQLGQSR